MTGADAWRLLKSRGLRYGLYRAWTCYVFGSKTWIVFGVDLEGPPAPVGSDGIVCRPFAPSDAGSLDAFEPHARASTILAQLEEGCWVDLAFDKGQPVAFRVVSSQGPRYPPLGRLMTLEPHQVYVVYSFCLPAYRGRGIATRLGLAMDRRLAAAGYRELVAASPLYNTASIRLQMGKGYRPISRLSFRRSLSYARYAVDTDAASLAEFISGRSPVANGTATNP